MVWCRYLSCLSRLVGFLDTFIGNKLKKNRLKITSGLSNSLPTNCMYSAMRSMSCSAIYIYGMKLQLTQVLMSPKFLCNFW